VFLPDGPLQSAAFLLASGVWIWTLAVNLNPLLRFDGYFLLADLLNVPDLQQRAFQLGRWQLREWLFGLGLPPPEPFNKGMRRWLVGFAWAVWCYRLVLFLGIALLVYHEFFKLLGALLLVVEVGWFIVRPMVREMREWWAVRQQWRWNRQTLRSLILFGVILAWLALPWQVTSVQAPALLLPAEQMVIYAPVAAQVMQLPVASGQAVSQGDLLALLDDPDLRYRLDKVERTILLLRWRLAVQTMENDPLAWEPVLQQELTAAHAERQALLDEQNRLRIEAPFAGRVVDVAGDVRTGDWLARDEALLTVIGGTHPLVKGYVTEEDQARIAVGARGLFYPGQPAAEPLAGQVLRIDQTPTRHLPLPYLASTQGGTVPVREQKDGRLVVEGSRYRVDLQLEQPWPVGQIQRGLLHIQSAPDTLLAQWWRAAQALYRRESGF
ncbi:MAG: HlyD family efflux transporter periplasmic adaptor subunit, partial [Magnetococcus sp. DMHC-8]